MKNILPFAIIIFMIALPLLIVCLIDDLLNLNLDKYHGLGIILYFILLANTLHLGVKLIRKLNI